MIQTSPKSFRIQNVKQVAANEAANSLYSHSTQHFSKCTQVQFVFNHRVQLEKKKSAFHSNCSGSQKPPKWVPGHILPEVI